MNYSGEALLAAGAEKSKDNTHQIQNNCQVIKTRTNLHYQISERRHPTQLLQQHQKKSNVFSCTMVKHILQTREHAKNLMVLSKINISKMHIFFLSFISFFHFCHSFTSFIHFFIFFFHSFSFISKMNIFECSFKRT